VFNLFYSARDDKIELYINCSSRILLDLEDINWLRWYAK